MKRDDDPKTLFAMRIKRKNKRLVSELLQAVLILSAFALFFTACWVFDGWIKKG